MGMRVYDDGPLRQHRTCYECGVIFFEEEDNPENVYMCSVCSVKGLCHRCDEYVRGRDRIGNGEKSSIFRCPRCDGLLKEEELVEPGRREL